MITKKILHKWAGCTVRQTTECSIGCRNATNVEKFGLFHVITSHDLFDMNIGEIEKIIVVFEINRNNLILKTFVTDWGIRLNLQSCLSIQERQIH